MIMKKELDFLKYKGALKHLAFNPADSLGRRFENDEDLRFYGDAIDPFLLDIGKIISSKSYRRLADKTQVFPPQKHPNIRNRLVHTNDVVSIALFAADILGLNRNLTEAITLAHDIGHTAYGHLGESAIGLIARQKFSHAVMGVVAAQKIERSGRGLNLSYEVLQGILHHSRGNGQMEIIESIPVEASLGMIADKAGYVPADLNDSFRVGYRKREDVPRELLRIFGDSQREMVARILFALVKESAEKGFLSFSDSEEAQTFEALKKWMYFNIYYVLDSESYRQRISYDLREMGEFFHNSPDLYPFGRFLPMALMTDSEAESLRYNKRKIDVLSFSAKTKLGFVEMLSRLDKNVEIDVFNPDLNPADFKFYIGENRR